MKAWLGLGSNLQNPAAQLTLAIRRLSDADGIEVLRSSSLYRTPPWGDELQDDFINAAVQIETSLAPLALLHVLQSIEDAMGRKRNDRRWGPRLIDLDLLLFGGQQSQSAELELPHPRMHERAFVLLPLIELEPTLEIPGRGKLKSLLSKIDCSGICRLSEADSNWPGNE
ncbi:MAG: 2-amino-4-hydroxy-6-hydroxymethyldihydropteridine diphosphokinase [Xanthomonadales bacterium]|nr:2-amino-4-hydroxy-6-hydroxymethyldihydropteridine diphosphokinase [Xanthomonadales bacterium]